MHFYFRTGVASEYYRAIQTAFESINHEGHEGSLRKTKTQKI